MSKLSLRCSELGAVLLCNGRLTLTRLVAPRESGPEAVMGQGVHWLAHDRIKRELGAVGEIGLRPTDMKAALHSEWIANFYFRHIQETVPADWSLECEADLDHEFDQFILTGHPDDIAMNAEATEAMIFDLKAGYLPVAEAEINSQLLSYLVLLFIAYPTLKKATLFLVQPRADEDSGEKRISFAVVEDVPQAVRYLESEINKAIANSRELETGEEQCKYCPAKIQCAAQIKLKDTMKHTLTDQEISRVKREPDDVLIADWYVDGKILSKSIDEATDLAKERIKANGYITSSEGESFQIETGGGAYDYPDLPKFLEAFKTVLPGDDMIARCWKPSKAKIFDAIADFMNIKKSSKKDAVTCESIWDGHFRSYCTQGVREKIVRKVI